MPTLLKSLRERGIYVFGRYNVMLITPPLTISRDELAAGVQEIANVLHEVKP